MGSSWGLLLVTSHTTPSPCPSGLTQNPPFSLRPRNGGWCVSSASGGGHPQSSLRPKNWVWSPPRFGCGKREPRPSTPPCLPPSPMPSRLPMSPPPLTAPGGEDGAEGGSGRGELGQRVGGVEGTRGRRIPIRHPCYIINFHVRSWCWQVWAACGVPLQMVQFYGYTCGAFRRPLGVDQALWSQGPLRLGGPGA